MKNLQMYNKLNFIMIYLPVYDNESDILLNV
jgi:hypothetical protein